MGIIYRHPERVDILATQITMLKFPWFTAVVYFIFTILILINLIDIFQGSNSGLKTPKSVSLNSLIVEHIQGSKDITGRFLDCFIYFLNYTVVQFYEVGHSNLKSNLKLNLKIDTNTNN